MRIASASVACLVALVACGTTATGYFPAADSPGVDKAIEQGWLPTWLPQDAEAIDERHDLDSNASIVQFQSTKLELPPGCSTVTDPPEATISANWWDSNVDGAAVFQCGDQFVAIKDSLVRVWVP